ncbi:hypothetical protein [uncultured Vibrio sp.]|uniref:hypothetical protein n=1 Tax=uncultured Vibrio sp. TaxID=114054 RepID=UPI0026076A52|nr:hypothetical protein [uncultured Vibrio sp.]
MRESSGEKKWGSLSIRVGRLPTLFDCEDRFLQDEVWTDSPKVEQHTLSSYQQILEEVK